MKKKRGFIAAGFLSTAAALTLIASPNLFAKGDANTTVSKLEALTKFTRVIGTVEKYYVDDLTINEIINKAIKGLMANLDAHSSFLDAKSFKEMKIQTSGEFGGLGVTVGMRDGALTVIAPLEGTPAYKAGLKAGDIILKINDKSTLNMTLDEAVSLMRGKPKTKITLTIVRKNEPKPIVVTIIRDIIKIQSVYTKKVGNDILYVRIVSFDKKVVKDIKKALADNPSAKGLILDLRNNPGGLLDQAVGTVDLFVDKGVIVSQKGRVKDENEIFKAHEKGTYRKIPMVVLVNGGSASASEIVSGSLQDHRRAVVIGEKTFGKGSVQIIMPINKTEALRLTIARYYLPSGRTIQAVGVTPDILVPFGKVTVEENAFSIKEAELKKHLESELEKIETKGTDRTKTKKLTPKKERVITKEDLYNDNQLKEGVDILRALIITQEKK
ncbi:S41 family peptidase [Hydrogenimonas cancrithermarum]|uniref:Protease n=1 Tax=Hydrogenimonas cancrithermarum TaxID=2993563 RepID=A0ABM8FIF1_9BACT|nr:S41 family peptidase [Hydrogenimonas cancrithermarum]BDY12066.1 protease [Hydrogenimonas cancrithermarum]